MRVTVATIPNFLDWKLFVYYLWDFVCNQIYRQKKNCAKSFFINIKKTQRDQQYQTWKQANSGTTSCTLQTGMTSPQPASTWRVQHILNMPYILYFIREVPRLQNNDIIVRKYSNQIFYQTFYKYNLRQLTSWSDTGSPAIFWRIHLGPNMRQNDKGVCALNYNEAKMEACVQSINGKNETNHLGFPRFLNQGRNVNNAKKRMELIQIHWWQTQPEPNHLPCATS